MESQARTNRRRAWTVVLAVGGVSGAGGLASASAWMRQPETPPAQTPGQTPAPAPAQTPAQAGRPVAPAQPAVQPPAGQPADDDLHQLLEEPLPEVGGDELITLTAFTEPVELSALVEYAATTLGINITVKGTLSGTVTFNAPVSIQKRKLLPLVDALLDQHGWTITLDPTGFYIVQQRTEVPVNFDGDLATTKIIPTPNVRPSALRNAIRAQFGETPSGTADAAGQPGAKGVAYVDELGVIVVTDSPRRIAAIDTLVQKLMGEYLRSQFTRLELEYVAAPTVRDRALALIGQSANTSRFPFQEQQQQPQQLMGKSGAVDNLADRLTVDPQGNALIFRGTTEELEQVRAILKVIDVPSQLQPKPYEVGSSAKQIANIARDRGLGEVTTITTDAEREMQLQFGGGYGPDFFRQQNPGSTTGGPVMVVDETRGRIIYYGTSRQHEAFATLVSTLGVEDERIVLQPYRLKNAKAEDVATLIQGLLTNQTPTGDSSLLPQGQGGNRTGSRFQQQPPRNQPTPTDVAGARPGEEGMSFTAGEETFVIADVANNQVIVKAPAKLQPQFKQLIDRIDLRRAQVYIECKIVAVNWTDEFRLAFETQLINAGGSGGVLNTNFGLSNFPAGTQLNQPKNVATGLAGLTAAIIKSDQIPIIITALQREVDSRILSSPQLLVDDNEEATIASLDEQPTSTVSQGTSTTETGFGGYEEAGTDLTVTPHISEAGYIRLEYEAKLSSFTGQATATLPPPRQTNTISAKSVTLPTDFTVVLGGLNLDSKSRTVVKVPLLGDIPIIGALFSDDNKNNRRTTLYVFLTPRILKDENFNDLKNLTRGPQYKSKLDPDIPDMKPSMMDVLRYGGEPPEPAPMLPPVGEAAPAMTSAAPGGRIESRPEETRRPEPPTEISPDDGGGR